MAGATLTRPPARTPEVIPMSTDESTLALPRGSSQIRLESRVGATSLASVASAYLNDSLVQRRLAPRTLELRRQQLHSHVLPLLGYDTSIDAISTRDVRLLAHNLERRGLSGSTVRSCVGAASAVLRYAVRELEMIDENPVRALDRGDLPSGRRASEPRYLSVDEVRRLLEALTPTFRAVASACFWAGLRISEALALRWDDVDFTNRRLHVRGSKTPAGRATVPLAGALAHVLEEHRQRELEFGRFSENGLVFQTCTGRTPGRRNAYRAISRAAVKAGLVPPGAEPIAPHDLRHSFAAFLLEKLSLVEVARLMRHASVNITAHTYAGITDRALHRLTEQLDALAAASEKDALTK